jgi:GNAT superfamily N-acetyltransferase
VRIRDATDDDWPRIYPLVSSVVAAGRTYAYPEDMASEAAYELWMLRPPGRTVVAVEDDTLLGTATMSANRPGRGAHIATASFMVDPAARGRGVGRVLGEHVIAWATDEGFRGIQFNAVVESNAAAVHLWQSLGFAIVGTVPGAFRHAEDGYVGLHVMFRPLP